MNAIENDLRSAGEPPAQKEGEQRMPVSQQLRHPVETDAREGTMAHGETGLGGKTERETPEENKP